MVSSFKCQVASNCNLDFGEKRKPQKHSILKSLNMKNSSGEVIVDFCFRRAGRIILVASALAFVPSFVVVPSAKAQAAAQPNWKDRDEYDAFTKVQQTTDPKARLEALKAWEDKYPTSDFIGMRNQYYLDTYSKLAGTDPSMRQKLLDKAQESLKADPKNPNTLYMICLWGPITGGANPSADLQAQVDSAAHALDLRRGRCILPRQEAKGTNRRSLGECQEIGRGAGAPSFGLG